MCRVFCLIVILALAGCGGATNHRATDAELQTTCKQPRAQVCTMEYAPVCAVDAQDQRREYSNACGACAQPAVKAYVTGPCPQ